MDKFRRTAAAVAFATTSAVAVPSTALAFTGFGGQHSTSVLYGSKKSNREQSNSEQREYWARKRQEVREQVESAIRQGASEQSIKDAFITQTEDGKDVRISLPEMSADDTGYLQGCRNKFEKQAKTASPRELMGCAHKKAFREAAMIIIPLIGLAPFIVLGGANAVCQLVSRRRKNMQSPELKKN